MPFPHSDWNTLIFIKVEKINIFNLKEKFDISLSGRDDFHMLKNGLSFSINSVRKQVKCISQNVVILKHL